MKLRKFNQILEKEDLKTWQIVLREQVACWASLLPKTLKTWSRNLDSPIERFYAGEFKKALNSLQMVKAELREIHLLLAGAIPQTNTLRESIASIIKGQIPTLWSRKSMISPNSFILELVKRWDQLLVKSVDPTGPVWIGGLYDTGAYVTATRQYCAKLQSISLEKLVMTFSFEKPNSQSFEVSGLSSQGFICSNETIQLVNNVEMSNLPSCYISWSEGGLKDCAEIPVFADSLRDRVLFYLSVRSVSQDDIIIRGVAAVCSVL